MMRAGMARSSQPLAAATSPRPGPPALTAVDGDGRVASRIFDIPIELAQPADMLRTIAAWVGSGEAHRVMYVNAHVVNESRAIPELRRALETADLVYCAGYGVRLAAMCEVAGSSLYLLGSDPPVARDAAARLQRWYPDLRIAGAHHGYFDLDSPHNERVIEDINAKRPDIVLVGMGTPKQELWLQRYADRIDADVLWTVGALLDYIAGRVPRAPRWLADNGLEWIWRLAIEPHRMWRRYLLGNPKFLSRVFTERQRAQR